MLYTIIYLIIYYALYVKVRLPLLKIYQFNYNNRLYFKWLSDHLRKAFNHLDIYAGLLTILSFYVSDKIKAVLLLISMLLIIYDTENIKYTLMIDKENLKIPREKRIFRLLTLYIVILLIPFILGLIYSNYRVFCIGIGIIFLVFSFVFVCLTNMIVTPIEVFIKKIIVFNILNKIDKANVNFIGVIGTHGKTCLANILLQFYGKNTYFISNLEELYDIDFLNSENIIVKINCVDNSVKNIHCNHVLCSKEFDDTDMLLLRDLDFDYLYFYKQNEYVNKLKYDNVFYYGIEDSLINLINYKIINDKTEFTYTYNNKKYTYTTTLLGLYNIYHLLAAILLMENSRKSYKSKISSLKNLDHNLNIKILNGFTMIDDTYHTNVESFNEGLDILREMKGTRILVTPGLIGYNTIISKNIISACDYIILIGERNSKTLYDALIKNKFDKNKIFITNDTYESYAMISNLDIEDDIYALYENKLSNLYKD